MHIADCIELYLESIHGAWSVQLEQATRPPMQAGGPGSGRHPEYGSFKHVGVNTAGSTNYHRFESSGGTKVSYHQNFRPSFGKVFEDGKVVHEGDTNSAGKFLKSRYGIED